VDWFYVTVTFYASLCIFVSLVLSFFNNMLLVKLVGVQQSIKTEGAHSVWIKQETVCYIRVAKGLISEQFQRC
jgi:hypothetical protein